MAGEIRLKAAAGTANVKALIVGADGKVWNGSAMVALKTLSDAEWTASLLVCVEEQTGESSDTGFFVANWPGALTKLALYDMIFFVGANPSPGDVHIGRQSDPTEYASSATGLVIASQITILARLGSWTGTARNTILGAFQALFRRDPDATVPSDVNADLGGGIGTASNVTDSVQGIRDWGDVAWITGTGGGGGIGSGVIEVDHDTGGVDNLRYVTTGGIGIDNATIYAYLRDDWDAGYRDMNAVRAWSLTNVEGRWGWPMLLDPGWYVMYFFKQSAWGSDTAIVLVE